jgi:hypothetical protein
MPKILQILCLLHTALTVGVVQIVGVSAGYWCSCTGQRTVEEDCQMAACHTSHNHAEDCGGDHDHRQGGDHTHTTARDSFESAPFHCGPALPLVLWLVLPSAPQPIVLGRSAATDRVALRPRPPDDTSPPIALVVVETAILLI